MSSTVYYCLAMPNGKLTKKVPKTRMCFFRATEADWKRIEAIQERTGASPSEQMRRGLWMWLDKQESKR
jgi:hypothetical protein